MKTVTARIRRRAADQAILLVRRGPDMSLAGWWATAGGKVGPNQFEAACLVRGLADELQTDVEISDFIVESLFAARSRGVSSTIL